MFKIYFLIPILVPLALVKWDFSMGMCHRAGRWLGRLAERRRGAVIVAGLFSLALSAGFSLSCGIPAPQVHDEFGNLLIGDTFAHGRVTNPTPALPEHFESIHIIVWPTYTAKYPPALGLALAGGEKLGLPVIGVWLAVALACAAMCWMFQAWMPPRWALAGGLMAALHPQVLEWSQNYWGGEVAMAGGALLIGGFRRLMDGPRARDAVWMALGLGVLANSRPFEGFVLGSLVLVALLAWLIRRRGTPLGVIVRQVFLPMAAVLAMFCAQLLWYNWRVTGSPLMMPYVLHERLYGIAPLFLFGSPRPEPVYHHEEIRRLQEQYLAYFESQRTSIGALATATGRKLWCLGEGYAWSGLLVVALAGLPWAVRRDRRLGIACLLLVFFVIAEMACTWVFTHYAAPAFGLFLVLVLESMRSLNTWRIGSRRVGHNLVRGLALLFVVSGFQVWAKMHAADPDRWYLRRQAIIDELNREPGRSLVIVKYEPDHNPNREWVYNGADLTGGKVILARDMGEASDRELIAQYPGRNVLVVDADAPEPKVEAYPGR
jgi:hypothetical protein